MAQATLHAVGTLLLLPYVALASWFLLVGNVARAQGPWAVIDAFLSPASWFVTWGIYVIPVVVLALIVAGILPGLRRPGALVLALISACSLVTIIGLHSGPLDAGQYLFLSPCVAVFVGAVWLYRRSKS